MPVTVEVMAPEQRSEGRWFCTFRIVGLDGLVEEAAEGIDGLQALQLAIEATRHRLEESPHRLTWLDGRLGELGLPRMIPWAFGAEVEARLWKLVSEELDRLVRGKHTAG